MNRYWMIKGTEKIELENLERLADQILCSLSKALNDASESDLMKLEQIAGRSAKIAFGSGQANLLSEQMQNLIRWTDHLDDTSFKQQFTTALRNRPLVAPW